MQAGSKVYTYDQNGNRITEDAKAYQYDWANRLTSITAGDETTNFAYDGDGSRTSQEKIVSGATIEASSYIYDPSAGIPRLLQEEIVSGPSLSYVYAGRLLEQTGGLSGTMFYNQDAIGNTLAMTDMTGVAVNTYRYDAFGASELISGTAHNNRQFTGHVSDSTGLIYMNARYYDPATGRFLTQDTVPGRQTDPLSYNLYAYCKNNPVAYTDPSGHLRVCAYPGLNSAPGGMLIPNMANYINSQKEDIVNSATSTSNNFFDDPEVQANMAEWYYYHPDNGYVDVNWTFGIIAGMTAGVQIDSNDNVHAYVGVGLVTPGSSVSVQFCDNAPASSGNYVAIQGQRGVSGQTGIQLNNLHSGFNEVGVGWVPGASATVYHVTGPLFSLR